MAKNEELKIAFWETKGESEEYTSQLLKYLCRKRGIEIVDDFNKANSIWISSCDVVKFIDFYKMVKHFGNSGKVLIVGGVNTILPVYSLYSYAYLGEAYDFILNMPKFFKSFKKYVDNHENIKFQQKPAKKNYNIIWEMTPVIKTSKRGYYFYAGKGCRRKCKFCFPTHVEKFQYAPEPLVISILRKIPKGRKLTLITNELPYKNIPYELQNKLAIQNLTAIEYAMHYEKYKNLKWIKMGIEFFSERMRKLMGKPIPNNIIRQVFEVSKFFKQNLILFFIVGIEKQEDVDYFIEEVIPEDRDFYPYVYLKLTYIDFCFGTPLQNLDVRIKKEFDLKSLYSKIVYKNRRFRAWKIKYMAHSTWRTFLGRVTTREEAELMFKLRNEKNNEKLIKIVEKEFPHLLGNEGLTNIIF